MKPVALDFLLLSGVLLFSQIAASQGSVQPRGTREHKIPFGSGDNAIELEVDNQTEAPLTGIIATVDVAPAWISWNSTRQEVGTIEAKGKRVVAFRFSLNKTSAIGTPEIIRFTISGPRGEKFAKAIRMSVLPPDHVELFQNFPNPFNPVSTIPFQLARPSRVTLEIFNALGQTVETILNENLPPGYYERRWNADRASSGVYFCRLAVQDENGERVVQRRRMLLLR